MSTWTRRPSGPMCRIWNGTPIVGDASTATASSIRERPAWEPTRSPCPMTMRWDAVCPAASRSWWHPRWTPRLMRFLTCVRVAPAKSSRQRTTGERGRPIAGDAFRRPAPSIRASGRAITPSPTPSVTCVRTSMPCRSPWCRSAMRPSSWMCPMMNCASVSMSGRWGPSGPVGSGVRRVRRERIQLTRRADCSICRRPVSAP